MGTLRYLDAEDVRALLPPVGEVISLVEEALRLSGEGKLETPAGIGPGPGEAGPSRGVAAHVADACGVKWLAGCPPGLAAGLPAVDGLVVLHDPQSGRPLAALDGAAITAARTGACTAVTAKYLADSDSEVLAIVGCGVQGRANLAALLAVFPGTERMLCYDVDIQRQAAFADETMEAHSVASIVPPDPRETVEGAHIVVSAVPQGGPAGPVIEPDWLQPGTLAIALDGCASFTPATFGAADRLVTDSLEQFSARREQGDFTGVPDPDAELPAIVAGRAPGRGEGSPTVLAANFGLGMLDVALAGAILARAEAAQRGALLDT